MQQKSFAHQPALDGVRAVAVLLVLLFHAGFTFVPAGYLGVSVFFTLSGYLITSLLLHEHDATGRVALRAFWSRRLKRLLPASLLCVLAIVIAHQFGAFARVEGLRGDIAGAVLQVYNWVQLAGTTSYGDLFAGATSPLEHYWSLSIEEQFYWVWPVVLWALLRLGRRRGWSISALVIGVTVAMSVTAVAIAVWFGPDAAYWATPARLPEILVGASVACLLHRRTVAAAARWLAPAALVAIVALSCTWPSASGPAYDGWLPAFALLGGLLVVGLQPASAVRRALSIGPIAWMGRISYGLYLYHWPVFVVLRERGWQLSTWWGATVALSITFAAAAASFHLFEQPIRRANWAFAPTARAAAIASVAVLATTALVGSPAPFIQADDELLSAASIAPAGDSLAPLQPATTTSVAPPQDTDPIATTPPAPLTTAPPTTSTTLPIVVQLGPPPSRPVRMMVVGDSTALYVGQGLAAWSLEHPDAAQVGVTWCQGCSFMLDPAITTFDISNLLENSRDTIDARLPAAIRTLQPDVVVLMVTVNDVANREWSPDEGPLTPFDPRFVDRMTTAYADLTYGLLAQGVGRVEWIVPPRPEHLWLEPEMNEMDRYPVQHEVIRDVAAMFDDRVGVIDLDAWLTAAGHDRDPWWRADGVHLTDESATALAEQFLGPLIVQRTVSPG